jgi:hypothetical protein
MEAGPSTTQKQDQYDVANGWPSNQPLWDVVPVRGKRVLDGIEIGHKNTIENGIPVRLIYRELIPFLQNDSILYYISHYLSDENQTILHNTINSVVIDLINSIIAKYEWAEMFSRSEDIFYEAGSEYEYPRGQKNSLFESSSVITLNSLTNHLQVMVRISPYLLDRQKEPIWRAGYIMFDSLDSKGGIISGSHRYQMMRWKTKFIPEYITPLVPDDYVDPADLPYPM